MVPIVINKAPLILCFPHDQGHREMLLVSRLRDRLDTWRENLVLLVHICPLFKEHGGLDKLVNFLVVMDIRPISSVIWFCILSHNFRDGSLVPILVRKGLNNLQINFRATLCIISIRDISLLHREPSIGQVHPRLLLFHIEGIIHLLNAFDPLSRFGRNNIDHLLLLFLLVDRNPRLNSFAKILVVDVCDRKTCHFIRILFSFQAKSELAKLADAAGGGALLLTHLKSPGTLLLVHHFFGVGTPLAIAVCFPLSLDSFLLDLFALVVIVYVSY
jgi:hypothetical protein